LDPPHELNSGLQLRLSKDEHLPVGWEAAHINITQTLTHMHSLMQKLLIPVSRLHCRLALVSDAWKVVPAADGSCVALSSHVMNLFKFNSLCPRNAPLAALWKQFCALGACEREVAGHVRAWCNTFLALEREVRAT
jgi:hypothetical protein